MINYLCVEMDGDAHCVARFIKELLRGCQELLVDQRGFLLVPERLWDDLKQLAATHRCELRLVTRASEAA